MALLDGLPLENHALLRGHLIIDDPDDHQSRYQPTSSVMERRWRH